MSYPDYVFRLVEVFRRLPGVGLRTAERYVFSLLSGDSEDVRDMARGLLDFVASVSSCEECGCLKDAGDCKYCADSRKIRRQLCVVSSVREVFSLESTREFRGMYHILGGLLSPLEGRGPECLTVAKLAQRITEHKIEEVIIALDSTLEGDATALYLKECLGNFPIKISRLAFGLPMGSSLDIVDGGTLAQALSGRQVYR